MVELSRGRVVSTDILVGTKVVGSIGTNIVGKGVKRRVIWVGLSVCFCNWCCRQGWGR